MSTGTKTVCTFGAVTAAAVAGKALLHEPAVFLSVEKAAVHAPLTPGSRLKPGAGLGSAEEFGAASQFSRGLTVDQITFQVGIAKSRQAELSHKVLSMYDQASSNILADLNPKSGALTQQKIESVINKEVIKTIESEASQPNSGITFEVLTGKLKIESSLNIYGLKLTGGEVNIYKVSGILAGGVTTCAALSAPAFTECAKAALAEIGNVVAKEIKAESTSNSTETK